MNFTIRKLTDEDRQNISCKLEGYWGIFEDGRVSAVSRERADLEEILAKVHGAQAEQQQVAA